MVQYPSSLLPTVGVVLDVNAAAPSKFDDICVTVADVGVRSIWLPPFSNCTKSATLVVSLNTPLTPLYDRKVVGVYLVPRYVTAVMSEKDHSDGNIL